MKLQQVCYQTKQSFIMAQFKAAQDMGLTSSRRAVVDTQPSQKLQSCSLGGLHCVGSDS